MHHKSVGNPFQRPKDTHYGNVQNKLCRLLRNPSDSLFAVIVCIIGNIINVYAEEGLFRGPFCIIGIQYYSQKAANIIQALLFGIWHITNIINPLLDGSMNTAMVALMGIGYILLSGISAYEWGMCAALSETLWIGASEHLFNNFISNSLHTVTEPGADELMIIRITLSYILSLLFVLIISQKKIHSKLLPLP